MKRYNFLLLLICFSCKDIPYREPEAPKPPEQNVYNFTGTVELGTPVSGAAVKAYRFSNLRKGDQIGEAITNRDGGFDLNLKTEYDGPLLLVTNGGVYRDLITNETIALKPAHELTSAITHIKMPEKTNINAWTTLAVARIKADRGFWDKSVAELKDIDRINVDFSHISYYLSGKSTNHINIRRQEFYDREKESFRPDEPKVVLHLAHGGLSQIAHDFTNRLKQQGIVVDMIDIVLALAEDLSDRVFDGKNASGGNVYVGSDQRINLTSYTMRRDLSHAIRLYSQHLQGLGKITEEDKKSLEAPGKMVETIASDKRPELFPEAEEPKPLDKEPPELFVRFAYKHSAESMFAFLQGDVTFDVQADDETGIKSVHLLEPQMIEIRSPNKFGPIAVSREPQAMIAAKVCGKEKYLQQEIDNKGWSEANMICACFEAVDVFNNAKKELACFQREIPKPMISFPTDKTVLSSQSFLNGVKVKARVTSGLPIEECSWRIQDRLTGIFLDDQVLPYGRGMIDGTTCTIEEALDGSKFLNGNYYLVLVAKDIGGRILQEKYDGIYSSMSSFQVFKEPPPVEIISPANNDYVETDFIPVFGRVEQPETIKEISLEYRGIDLNNEDIKGNTKVPIKADSGDWSVSLGEKLVLGGYALELTILDIYGNEKSYPLRMVTIDHQPPTILGATDGIPQSDYLQETVNYRQRFIDDKENPHYEVIPAGNPVPLGWHKIPTINRWSTRLNDSFSAPRYSFRVSDDHKLKEVRFKFNYKCSSLEEATKTVRGQEGNYDISLTQNNASFDLSRDSEADGHMQRYCLSIWAIDQAGNTSNHNVEMVWKVISPPISLEINSSRYRAHRQEDDITFIGKPMWEICGQGNPMRLKRSTVIGHAILSNPHKEPVAVKLLIKKPIGILLSSGSHKIPEKHLSVEYFAYDMVREEIGPHKNMMDNSTIINPNEIVLAKMMLTKDFLLEEVNSWQDNFWQKFRLEVGFTKSGDKIAMVDELKILSKEPNVGFPQHEFEVPWGDSHNVRRRIPSRFGG